MAENTRRTALAVISPLLAAILTLVGYSFLAGRSAGAYEQQVEGLERRVDKVETYMQSIDQRLAWIEGKLGRER